MNDGLGDDSMREFHDTSAQYETKEPMMEVVNNNYNSNPNGGGGW